MHYIYLAVQFNVFFTKNVITLTSCSTYWYGPCCNSQNILRYYLFLMRLEDLSVKNEPCINCENNGQDVVLWNTRGRGYYPGPIRYIIDRIMVILLKYKYAITSEISNSGTGQR